MHSINPIVLKSSSKIDVCIYHSFDNNFGIDDDFTEYLKESCWYRSNWHFSIKYFHNYAFSCKLASNL